MSINLRELAPTPNETIPDFNPGDTVRVEVRVVEGDRERIQAFEGVEVTRRGRVRRARLYYLRGRTGRAARVKEARRT